MPNHTALVENGRCGSECRVCDHLEFDKSQKENEMKKGKGIFRYFLQKGDSEDEVTEINKDVFETLSEEPDAEVEEVDEDEVQLEEEIPGIESEEVDAEEGEDDEVEVDEDEESEEDKLKDKEEMEADEGEEGSIFEVQLDDGTIGKMDKVAYDYFTRYMKVQKKGDASEMKNDAVEMMSLSATAGRILGSQFAVDSFCKKGVSMPAV